MSDNKLTGQVQTTIQPVVFETRDAFLNDLTALLEQSFVGEIHLGIIPQADGAVMVQGAIVHANVNAPVVALVGEDQ